MDEGPRGSGVAVGRGNIGEERRGRGRSGESVLSLVEEKGRECLTDGAGAELAVVAREGSLADADHVEDFSEASGPGGLRAVEARAFGGSEVACGIVSDGVPGVKLSVETGRFGGSSAGGATKDRGGAGGRRGARVTRGDRRGER